MKTNIYLFIIGIIFIMFTANSINASTYIIGNDTIQFMNGNYYFISPYDTVLVDSTRISIKFIPNTPISSISAFEMSNNLTLLHSLSNGKMQYRLPLEQNFIVGCNNIVNNINVEKLFIHFYMRFYEFEPNDGYISDQWYLKNIGVYDEVTKNGVWDITKGSSDIIIAVIDGGLDWDHEEFGPVYDNIDIVKINQNEDEWTNWNDPLSGNNIDDDINNLVDDWKGWDFFQNDYVGECGNFVSEDNDVRYDKNVFRHGNAVTGIIAAKTNNLDGVAGIGGGDSESGKSGLKIIPIKVIDYIKSPFCNTTEAINTADVELAILYAVDMGAKVINMSFGCGYSPNQGLEYEVEYAFNNGVTLVSSSGNSGYSNYIGYPARLDLVIAVGATKQDDDHWIQSNAGEEMEIAAPGENITVLDDYGVVSADGTSFSAPMVSATIGLMLSVNPFLSNEDINEVGSIRNILMRTADKTGQYPYVNGWNSKLGYGRLNTYDGLAPYKSDNFILDYKSTHNSL